MGYFRSTIDWFKAKKAVEDAGREIGKRAAEYMTERAKLYAPVDTGLLHSSIQYELSLVGSAQSFGYTVFATAPYAAYVEFGHMAGAGTWVAPNPFLRNALADTRTAFPQIARSVEFGSGQGPGPGHLGVSFEG